METLIVLLLLIVIGVLFALLQNLQKIVVVMLEMGSRLDSEENYPVVSYNRIKRQREKLIEQNEDYSRKKQRAEAFAEDKDKKTPNKVKSEPYRNAMMEYFDASAKSTYELNVYRTMIEVNWLVRSGKKTIEEADLINLHAQADFPGHKAKELYKDWLER